MFVAVLVAWLSVHRFCLDWNISTTVEVVAVKRDPRQSCSRHSELKSFELSADFTLGASKCVFFLLPQDFRARLCGDSGYKKELIVSIMLSKTYNNNLRPSVVKKKKKRSTLRGRNFANRSFPKGLHCNCVDLLDWWQHFSFTHSEDAWYVFFL